MVREVLRIGEDNLAIEITGGEVASFRTKKIARIGMRLFAGGRVALASHVGGLSEDDLEQKCLALREVAVPYDHQIPSQSNFERSLLRPEWHLREKFPTHVAEALDYLVSKKLPFTYQGQAHHSEYRKTFTNSQAVRHHVEYESTGLEILWRRNGSSNILDGSFAAACIGQADFKAAIDANVEFLEAYDRLLPIRAGRYPVFFLEPEPNMFRKIIEACLIDRYHDGSALFSGQLGKKIFDNEFSIDDLRFSVDSCVVQPFDGEGTLSPLDVFPLVEGGVLKNLVCDLRYAKKFGAMSTGNGQRSFNSNAILGFNVPAFGRGQRDWRALLADQGECVVVMLAAGGDCTDTGVYSTPVNLAFLARNGRIEGRLPQLTVYGTLMDCFGSGFRGTSRNGFAQGAVNPCLCCEMDLVLN